MSFIEWSPRCFKYPPGSIRSYLDIIDYIPYIVLDIPISILYQLVLLNPSLFSPRRPPLLPSDNCQPSHILEWFVLDFLGWF